MLNRITIGSKMTLLLAVAIALLVVTGAYGLIQLQSENAQMRSIVDNSMVPLSNLKLVSDFYQQLPSAVDDVEMSRQDPKASVERIRGLRDRSLDAWATYLKSASSAREGQLRLSLRGPMQEANEAVRRLEEVLLAMDIPPASVVDAEQLASHVAAGLLTQTEADAKLFEAQELAAATREQRARLRRFFNERVQATILPVLSHLDPLISELLNAASTELERSNERFSESVRKIGFMVGGGVLFLMLLGAYLRFSVTRSLGRVNGSLQRLASAEADLSQRLAVDAKDEIGQLAGSFNHLMQRLEAMVRQAHLSGIQVQSGTNELTAGAKELEATVTEQVASTSEVVASAKQISATAAELTHAVAQVAEAAQSTAWTAGEGQQGLQRMDDTMSSMQSAATTISDKLAAINDKAENISSIVTTINKIADQTNLLSLNASIEAEKAGEYGQGFAVVAREIRRLADQTAVSTLDIEKMVKDMKATVASGVMSADKFQESVRGAVQTVADVSTRLSEIIEQIQALSPRFEAVTGSAEAQSLGARQISEAMVQLGTASRSTAERIRKSNQALEELSEASSGLQAEFSRFSVSLQSGDDAGTSLQRG